MIPSAIGTAVALQLFPSKKSFLSHTKTLKNKKIPIRLFKQGAIDNFNPARLAKNPYPKSNRPRGKDDLSSVRYHRKTLRNKGKLEPIVLFVDKGQKILLDGVHRVVASYLEKKRSIEARLFTRKKN